MAVAAIGAVFAGAGVAFAGVSVATMAMVGTAITVVGAVTKNKNLMQLGAGFGIGSLAGGAYNAMTSGAADAAASGAAEGAANEAAQEAAQEGAKQGLVEKAAQSTQGYAMYEPAAGQAAAAPAQVNPAAALRNEAIQGAGSGAAKESVVPKGFWNNLSKPQGEVIGGAIKGVGAGAAEYLGNKQALKDKFAIINDQRRYASQIPAITRGNRKYVTGGI